MSLKVFHLVFIIFATLLSAGCAVWAFYHDTARSFAIGCIVLAIALVGYGIWFVKKSKGIIT